MWEPPRTEGVNPLKRFLCCCMRKVRLLAYSFREANTALPEKGLVEVNQPLSSILIILGFRQPSCVQNTPGKAMKLEWMVWGVRTHEHAAV